MEIDKQENLAFLEWRRDLAAIEEGNIKLAITPFEKNIEVWRQLWRVIEKSDLLLQIVDARNPYFFYSEDLEQYISEVSAERNKAAEDSDDESEDDDEDEDEDEEDEKSGPKDKTNADKAKENDQIKPKDNK